MTTMSAFLKRQRKSGTTAAAKRRVTQKGEKVPQLGEQANQSCPPLKVFSDDIVVDGMAPGTKIGDYMSDDVQFELLEEEYKYRYGHPLVKPGTPLSTMMRRLHEWYLDYCKSSGIDNLLVM